MIEPGAIIQSFVTIGDDVRICAGATIGIKSFSPARYKSKAITLEDMGFVVIKDSVEICAQSGVAQGILPQMLRCLSKVSSWTIWSILDTAPNWVHGRL